jgi:hypothetical protein
VVLQCPSVQIKSKKYTETNARALIWLDTYLSGWYSRRSKSFNQSGPQRPWRYHRFTASVSGPEPLRGILSCVTIIDEPKAVLIFLISSSSD